ncbi:MAG TPA: ion transporter [Bacteroidetes bacterium]|nr:ion transporter [Bacteroidota bacterium]
MIKLCKHIAQANWFNTTVILAILLAGIVVGIETYGEAVEKWLPLLHSLDWLILWVFTVEAAIKILAEGDKPWRYFKDPWNIFDYIIVVVCWLAVFLPGMDADFVAVFRLARILRVLRLVHALPQLKLLVDAMLKSIPSMAYVGILLFLLFYIYGVMGVFVFGKNDPVHFGDLLTSIVTLFQITTLEGWADIMFLNVHGCEDAVYGLEGGCPKPKASGIWAMVYFISFVLIGTMIVMNLFIGVIMNSMDEVRNEQVLEERLRQAKGDVPLIDVEIEAVKKQMEDIWDKLDFIAFQVKERS